MTEVGKINKLSIIKEVDFGLYLNGGDLGNILLPARYAPQEFQIGDEVEVFIYFDSEDRLIATSESPYCQVGQCAHLEVTSSSAFGAFVDWGLLKDLLVPFKEQLIPMIVGKSYAVFVYIDVTGRIAASSKLSDFMKEEDGYHFTKNQEVDLLIARQNDFGYKAVVNNEYMGLVHTIDILSPIKVGDRMKGYVKNVRDDGKIDLVLQEQGFEAIDNISQDILELIRKKGGKINITDKSPPELIYETFKVSKSNYKKALGKLYKQRLITISKDEVELV
ncbi:MAG: putative RNA-binding protein (virulence factor B family) [Rickettsiales bacterium]|jgi:predicted RNA-binding protein (virulence factor B family)